MILVGSFLNGPGLCAEQDFTASVDVAYTTELLDKGESFYGDEDAVLVTVGVAYAKIPIDFAVSHRNALGEGFTERQRLDYVASYERTVPPLPASHDRAPVPTSLRNSEAAVTYPTSRF